MTNEITEFKEIVVVELFDDQLFSTKSIDEFEKGLSAWLDFVKINGELVSRHQIKRILKKRLNDLEEFIFCQSDPEVQKNLRLIINEREEKWLKINWTKHLRQIYLSRHNWFNS